MDMLTWKLPSLSSRYENVIKRDYLEEYSLLSITPTTRVLHIGCGAYPLTDIILAQSFSPKLIVGIDSNKHTVKKARSVVKIYGLQHKISVEHGDGQFYDATGFDLVIVSSCCWPKIPILHHLYDSVKPGCMILVRELQLTAEPVLHCIQRHSNIILHSQTSHHPTPIFYPLGWMTFTLEKTR
jgi:protein-L-isoaspartate O-methyltransferase